MHIEEGILTGSLHRIFCFSIYQDALRWVSGVHLFIFCRIATFLPGKHGT